MYLDEAKYKSRTKTWMRLIILAMLAGFVLTFWSELILTLGFLWGLARFLLGEPLTLQENTLNAFVTLAFNGVVFIIAFLTMAYFLAAQALVPVSTTLEKRRTTWHLILHMLRMHGPAVFIQNGVVIESEEDVKHFGPGLIAIDYNSAVVLEEQSPAPNIPVSELSLQERIAYDLGIYQPHESPRAVGAGITFTRPSERIRGVVDLRKQSRSRQEVRGYTRDGIEVTTTVWTLFTIGQNPEVLDIAYEGERHSKNLRILSLKKKAQQSHEQQIEVLEFLDELDPQDRHEIHTYAEEALRQQAMDVYHDVPAENMIPVFNPERVFAAVFSEARSEQDQVVPWVDLPPIVAVDVFREILSQYNYDQLFQPNQPADFPISKMRQLFRTQVRSRGALSYRLVFHKTRRPISLGTYDPNDLRVSEIKELRNPKILRERGIKVVACGFTDLVPPEEVYKQRLDSWRALWEKETRVAQAAYELEAMRLQNRARMQAQQELRYEFMKILQESGHPKEVLAIRVLQALENAAADPKTKQLLPQETLALMNNLDAMINHW